MDREVVCVGLECVDWCEGLEASCLKWKVLDRAMKLAVPVIRTISWLKIDQLQRVHREMGSMLIVHSVLIKTMPDCVRTTWGVLQDLLGPCRWSVFLPTVPGTALDFVLCVWGQEITFSFVFLVCSLYLARLEDMAQRRTLLENERLSPKID